MNIILLLYFYFIGIICVFSSRLFFSEDITNISKTFISSSAFFSESSVIVSTFIVNASNSSNESIKSSSSLPHLQSTIHLTDSESSLSNRPVTMETNLYLSDFFISKKFGNYKSELIAILSPTSHSLYPSIKENNNLAKNSLFFLTSSSATHTQLFLTNNLNFNLSSSIITHQNEITSSFINTYSSTISFSVEKNERVSSSNYNFLLPSTETNSTFNMLNKINLERFSRNNKSNKLNSVIYSSPSFNTIEESDNINDSVLINVTDTLSTYTEYVSEIRPTASSSWPKHSDTYSEKEFHHISATNPINEIHPIINLKISVKFDFEILPSFASTKPVSTLSTKGAVKTNSVSTSQQNFETILERKSKPIETNFPVEHKFKNVPSSITKRNSLQCRCLSEDDSITQVTNAVSEQSEICNCSTIHQVSLNSSTCSCTLATKNVLSFNTNLSKCSCTNNEPTVKIMNIPLNFMCKPNINGNTELPSSLQCEIKYDEGLFQPSSPFQCDCNIHAVSKSRPNAIQCICKDIFLNAFEEVHNCDCTLKKNLNSSHCQCNQSIVPDVSSDTTLNSTYHYVIDETKELKSISYSVTKDSSQCQCEEIELMNGQLFLRYNCTCNDENASTTQRSVSTSTTTITTTTTTTSSTTSERDSTKLTVTTTTAVTNSIITTNKNSDCKCEELKLSEGKIVILFNCSCPVKTGSVKPENNCNCDDLSDILLHSALNCKCPTSTTLLPYINETLPNSCKKLELMDGQLVIWINCSQHQYISTTPPPMTTLSTVGTTSDLNILNEFTRCKCQDIFFHDSLWLMFNCTCYKNNDIILPASNKIQPKCRCKRDLEGKQCDCEILNTKQVFVEEKSEKIPTCSCLIKTNSSSTILYNNNCSCISTQKAPRSLTSSQFGCVCNNSLEVKDDWKHSVKNNELKTSPLMQCECNRNDPYSTTTASTAIIPLQTTTNFSTEVTTIYTILPNITMPTAQSDMVSSNSQLPSTSNILNSTENYDKIYSTQIENVDLSIESTTLLYTTDSTTLTADYLNENKQFWIRTVFHLIDAYKTFDQSILEQNLGEIYTQVFIKFYKTKSLASVKILNISKFETEGKVEVIYIVKNDGKEVLASTAVKAMEFINDQEMAIILKQVIIVKAEEYVSPLYVSSSAGLSTTEIIIIVLCIVLFLILLLLCIYIRYKSSRKNKKAQNQQQIFEEVSTVSSKEVKNESSPPQPIIFPTTSQLPDPPILINENESSTSSLYARPHKKKKNPQAKRKPKKRRKKNIHEHEVSIETESMAESPEYEAIMESPDSQRSIHGLIPQITPTKPRRQNWERPLPVDIYRTGESAEFLPNLKGAFDNATLKPIPQPRHKPIPSFRLPPMKSLDKTSPKEIHENSFSSYHNKGFDDFLYDPTKISQASRGIPWLKKADEHPPDVVITPSAQHKIKSTNWDEIDEIAKIQSQVPCPAEHFIREIREELQQFRDTLGKN